MTWILTAVAGILATLVVVLYIRQDRAKASLDALKTWLELHVEKATRDRSHMVRIPAEVVVEVLRSDTRTLPDPRKFNGKAPRHPATSSPARRRKMGAKP